MNSIVTTDTVSTALQAISDAAPAASDNTNFIIFIAVLGLLTVLFLARGFFTWFLGINDIRRTQEKILKILENPRQLESTGTAKTSNSSASTIEIQLEPEIAAAIAVVNNHLILQENKK